MSCKLKQPALIFLVLFLGLSSAYGFGHPAHPDGRVGRPGGWLSAGYASIFVERGIPGFDKTRFSGGLIFPVIKNLTIESSYMLESEDTLYHIYTVGFRGYSGNPIKPNSGINPDGRIGIPFIQVTLIGKMPDVSPEKHRYRVEMAALMPISGRFTLGGGWNYYEKDHPRIVDEFIGKLNYFPKSYVAGSEYESPDGVEGYPSFFLSGGGSQYGFFGQLDIAVPVRPNLTLTLLIRGERVASPYVRTAILSGRISFYPGN
ncbi:MAG: hypothetical protein CVT49_07555 [candidate division Zixibacteria bacterium HGW-Zixibacteria-1]|nr:MAG: hypothetical protein CVT49_07555 [candidate division Zixibacteria bacterium HGW-Zixibacteria-1]